MLNADLAPRTPAAGCSCWVHRRGFLRSAMVAGAASPAAPRTVQAQTASAPPRTGGAKAVAAPAPQRAAAGGGSAGMIIDCHGHYTTEPQPLLEWRKRQIAALDDPSQMPRPEDLKISDDQFRESVEGAQLKFQRERGTAVT